VVASRPRVAGVSGQRGVGMATATKTLWSVQAVGEVAGEVWQALSRKGKLTLAALEREVDAQPALTHLALGWLARENKIDLRQENRAVQVWLTPSAD